MDFRSALSLCLGQTKRKRNHKPAEETRIWPNSSLYCGPPTTSNGKYSIHRSGIAVCDGGHVA